MDKSKMTAAEIQHHRDFLEYELMVACIAEREPKLKAKEVERQCSFLAPQLSDYVA